MSGEIFFDFGVKPVKKRKSQVRESQPGSTENKEADKNSTEVRGERKKHHIWKRTDYAKANAADIMSFYGGGKQNEIEQPTTRMKLRLSRKPKKKSKHWQRIRGKERKEKKAEKDEEELISLLSEKDTSEKDEKERKKRKKRKKKRLDEPADDLEIDKKRRQWSRAKKRRSFRHEDSEDKTDDEEGTGLGEEAMNVSAPATESLSQSPSPSLLEENTKTALCAPSMESMMPEDADDVGDEKPPVNYKAMYGEASESKYIDMMELSVELRYWIVLALFICLLIIYRSFLPPLQCDTKFQ
ncbi:hypothetical protein ACH3XW_20740 [Acanthocheilonema viteae]